MSEISGMDFKYLMQNQKQINHLHSPDEQGNKQMVEYDSKIVSFRIGNQYYGIDIMMVKEILIEKKFTPIPNALDFVRGVLNLRGDIMPIIDLAKLFQLKTERTIPKEGESVIIIRVGSLLIGLIVEEITQVFPVRKSDMQPPSPLLGSINENYISGVIDIDRRLYVVLDTEAIFGDKEKAKKEILPQESDLMEEFFVYFVNQIEELCSIHVHSVNKNKFRELYSVYVKENNVKEMPKVTKDEAEHIVKQFYSTNTEEFWSERLFHDFKETVSDSIHKICAKEINGMNIGCSNGYETFSFYFALQSILPSVRLTAIDCNLGAISNASGMEVNENEVPGWMEINRNFINTAGNRYKIKKEINDKIYFEFHDAKNLSADDRKFDIIIARDMSLFMKEAEYSQFIQDIAEHLVSKGLLILGDSEVIASESFAQLKEHGLTVFVKK